MRPKALAIFILVVMCFLPSLTLAAVSQIRFITDKQTISPGQSSEVITIQTQDSSGNKVNLEETADVDFSSSSGTGEFLNQSGAAVTAYMSKGSANKNFYYRDNTTGTHTISVTIRLRESGTSWSVSQQVIVGSGGGGGDDDGNTGGGSSGNESLEDDTLAHARQSELSTLAEKKPAFGLNAGRARSASIGAPIKFEAEVGNLPKGSLEPRFYWSFGDGSQARGRVATHTYLFPGKYVVMLNAKLGERVVSAKTTATVTEPELVISSVASNSVGGCIKILNKSNNEVNLGGFHLKTGEQGFVFPSDTIIPAGTEIAFPSLVTGLKPGGQTVKLYYPHGQLKTFYAQVDAPQVAELRQQIVSLAERISLESPTHQTPPPPLAVIPSSSYLPPETGWFETEAQLAVSPTTPLPEVIELTPGPSLWRRSVLFLRDLFN